MTSLDHELRVLDALIGTQHARNAELELGLIKAPDRDMLGAWREDIKQMKERV